MRISWLRAVALAVAVGLFSSVATIVVVSALHPTAPVKAIAISENVDQEKINNCIKKTIEIVVPNPLTVDMYERFWRLCGNEVYNVLLFADFEIRRNKFIRQELDERVNLWMVVSITVSGVLLAGLQLIMSYNLANAGKAEFAGDTALLAEQGKISLQSSVTGLMVLMISLAFFVIYVKWIYMITEFQIEKPDNLTVPVTRMSVPGGIGYPTAQPQTPQASAGGSAVGNSSPP